LKVSYNHPKSSYLINVLFYWCSKNIAYYRCWKQFKFLWTI